MSYIEIIFPAVSAIVGGLVVYVFKMKDKREDSVSDVLKEIQTMVNSINLNVNTLKKEVENMVYDVRELRRKEEETTSKLHILEMDVNTNIGLVKQLERRIELVENNKK